MAEPPLDVRVQVTWPELAKLIERHPRIEAGQMEVDAARAGVDAIGAIPNPELAVSLGQGFARDTDTSRFEWELSLTVPLGWLAQRSVQKAAAEAEVELAHAEVQAIRRELLEALQTRFWNLLVAQEKVAVLEALEAQTAALLQTVERLVEKGEARPIETLRSSIEFEKIAAELAAAQEALHARRAELALWVTTRSGPDGPTLVAVADVQHLPSVPAFAEALSAAEATHPSLSVSRARTRSLQAQVEIEDRARVPDFAVRAFTLNELDRRAVGAEVAIDLPIFDWNSGKRAQAAARLMASQHEVEAARFSLGESLLEAHTACASSVATASRLKERVLPRSEEAAVALEKTWLIGEASLLELIDARRTLLDARNLQLAALSQAHIDCSRLSALVGLDTEEIR